MDLSKLSFGAPSAERDIAQGLESYFIESQTYKKFAEKQKYVLLGNRGTGKSAIFKILAARERNLGTLVLELSPENYSYEMLSRTVLQEHAGFWAKQGAYAAAWKYLIYVMIMKEFNKQKPNIKTGSAKKIYTYLRDNHFDQQSNPIALLISYLKRLEGVKIGQYEASIKTRELAKLYSIEEIINLLPDLNDLCTRRKVLVLVDELDKGWDASEDAKSFIAGLFQAAMSINDSSKDLRVFISLRQELYESIPALYEDVQKYRDVIENIEWDEESLLKLVASRIKFTVPGCREFDDKRCWNEVFAETLEYRQNKSFNYIIDRTLYRAREIILFCTENLQEIRKQGEKYPIDYPVITKAELTYSQERTKDIAAEYRFQYPGLLSVFEVFRGKPYTIGRTELEYICLSITTGEIKVDEKANWVKDQDPDFIIEVLWRIGFIRAQAVGGIKALRRSGSSYLGSHQVSNLNLRNISRFHVHPMFRSFLSMKESKETSDSE